MKTKKIISIILAALMLVSVAALSACGGDDKPAVTTPSGETPVSGEDTQAATIPRLHRRRLLSSCRPTRISPL